MPETTAREWDWVAPRAPWALFPIRYKHLWQAYKKAQGSYWTAEEIDWRNDAYEFEHKLNDDERHYVKLVLASFAANEGMVGENALVRFAKECPIPEACSFFQFQAMMEGIHNETYNDAIDRIITDPLERETLFSAIVSVPCVREKALWVEKWLLSDQSYSERLVAFAAVEGIFFSGSFAAIFWLKNRGLMPGLSFSNELISRDEGWHWYFACMLFQEFPEEKRPSRKVVVEILKGAVEIEDRFTSEALPVRLVGMNEYDMKVYIRFVADQIFQSLGFEGAIYGVHNPFSFMTFQGVYCKANFFEGRDSNYQRQKQTVTVSAADTHHLDNLEESPDF
jgi:ribonucleoside-diphosphate reductase subunit M2